MKKTFLNLFACSLLLIAGMTAFAQKEGEFDNGSGNSAVAQNSAREGFTPDNTPPLPNREEIMEGFEDITNLPGWAFQNNSDAPNQDWFQGNDTVFGAQTGAPTEYIAANFNSTSNTVISNWMITPELNFDTLQTFSFWTRATDGNTFPDRMEVRISTNGASTDVGTAPTDVGDFTDLVIEINPGLAVGGYPDSWTQFLLDDFSGYSGTGRVAFRYWVTDAGPFGANSNYIGVDTVETTEISCTVDSVNIVDSDGEQVYLVLNGECPEGVSIRADATGQIVETGVIVSGSTSVYVDFVPDSTYTAITPSGAETTSNTATVPTLGEWGMIAFMLLLMSSGLYFLRKRRLA